MAGIEVLTDPGCITAPYILGLWKREEFFSDSPSAPCDEIAGANVFPWQPGAWQRLARDICLWYGHVMLTLLFIPKHYVSDQRIAASIPLQQIFSRKYRKKMIYGTAIVMTSWHLITRSTNCMGGKNGKIAIFQKNLKWNFVGLWLLEFLDCFP